jgi:hypothetical protein
MYELHSGSWGLVAGDGYKLISTHKLSEHATREEAWEAFFAADAGLDKLELLVKKPAWSENDKGWPSCWDDPIDLDRWRDAVRQQQEAIAKGF